MQKSSNILHADAMLCPCPSYFKYLRHRVFKWLFVSVLQLINLKMTPLLYPGVLTAYGIRTKASVILGFSFGIGSKPKSWFWWLIHQLCGILSSFYAKCRMTPNLIVALNSAHLVRVLSKRQVVEFGELSHQLCSVALLNDGHANRRCEHRIFTHF